MIRAEDWSTTVLGPIESWPQSLKTVLRLMLDSRCAMWMSWGPELTFFCNDAYLPAVGVRRDWVIGSPATKVWAEIWPEVGGRIEQVLKTGEATRDEGLLLFLERSGYPEETYHTFSYSPVYDDAGAIGGNLCVVTEETARVIGGRRLDTLRELGAGLAGRIRQHGMVEAVQGALARNPRDLPFALVYLFDEKDQPRLACASGVEAGTAAGALLAEAEFCPWPHAEVLRRGAALEVADLGGKFAALPTGDWRVPPSRAVLQPVAKQGQERPAGFLVAGLNPYRTFDDAYAGFIALVAGQIAAGYANSRAYEEQRRPIEDALREEARTLDILNRVGIAVAGELDREGTVQIVTDAKARLYQASQKARDELRTLNETLEQRVTERTLQLKESERQFSLLVAGVIDYAIFMLDPGGRIISWNPGAERIKGYRAAEIIGQHFSQFYTAEDRANDVPGRALRRASAEGKLEAEGWRVRKDGSRFWANVVIDAIYDESGRLIGFAKITRDMTERRNVEEQLRQAQKMEAIGQLTGGVAHDFNNLLIIILGNLETLLRQLGKDKADPQRLRRVSENALRGAQRAAALTQRLLAFSRRQPLEPKSVNVNKLVAAMSDLLRRTLGEQIAIETVLAAGLWQTHADPNQLESAILNLAVNARDAMPEGGKLTVETANTHLDDRYADRQVEVAPGQYVSFAITDTGVGMSKEVLARVFEPFFTTKDIGHGTGLGLSQVYGFVKQSGGHVKIYSEPGQGTTVRIYLPRLMVEEEEAALPAANESARSETGTETILVVEDDDDVRQHSAQILSELGYRVFEAPNGQAALEILGRQSEVRLLFTDVGLPGGMNGRQLAEEARRRRPHLKVLFTTGYARNAIVHEGRLDPGVQVITKPFTFAVLAIKIRDLLEADAGPKRVLVVEDEELVRMVAADALKELGYRVEEAGSATEAANKVRVAGAHIDAAIIDIGLPDRRGDALAAELRALYADLPIVIASGYTESALQERFGKDPLLRFLTKPYDIERLGKTLRSLGVEASAARES